jgi:hypothetical protein
MVLCCTRHFPSLNGVARSRDIGLILLILIDAPGGSSIVTESLSHPVWRICTACSFVFIPSEEPRTSFRYSAMAVDFIQPKMDRPNDWYLSIIQEGMKWASNHRSRACNRTDSAMWTT